MHRSPGDFACATARRQSSISGVSHTYSRRAPDRELTRQPSFTLDLIASQ
jgi:hypothetical protein